MDKKFIGAGLIKMSLRNVLEVGVTSLIGQG